MSAIRSRDTQPEMSVRRLLHGEGYRLVVARRIAGYRPDVVFMRLAVSTAMTGAPMA